MFEDKKAEELRLNAEKLAESKKDFPGLLRRIETAEAPAKSKSSAIKYKARWAGAVLATAVLVLSAAVYGRGLNSPLPVAGGDSSKASAESDSKPAQGYTAVYKAIKAANKDKKNSVVTRQYMGVEETMEASASVDSADQYADAGFGETNVQVEGVDEGDIVKNDGKNLYILSRTYDDSYNADYRLSVVDAESMTILSQTTDFGDEIGDINHVYLSGDHLVLVGGDWMSARPYLDIYDAEQEDTGDWDLSTTTAVIYGIDESGQLSLIRSFTQEGYYVNSRMVGDNLYLISSKSTGYNIMNNMTRRNVEDFVPHTKDSDREYEAISADCILTPYEAGDVFTVASALSISDENKTETQSVLGGSGSEIYAANSNLYVISYEYAWTSDEETKLLKFELGDGTITPAGQGAVPGYTNNQFSADEKDGKLRIVTTSSIEAEDQEEDSAEVSDGVTSNMSFVSNTENRLYVLDEDLNIISKTEGLAPGESVKSVRFMGDMAYIVTFRQTDPLFTVDLSDPNAPKVLGQLKIPGFSTYMHPIGGGKLLGIGYDADEDTGGTTGIKFSIFDVSDPTNPTEQSKFVIEGNVGSDALYDHKAVTYIHDRGLLAVPVNTWTEEAVDAGGIEIPGEYRSVALILSVDPEGGIQPLGVIRDPGEDDGYDEHSISRISYIGEKLYAVSNAAVTEADMATLEITNHVELLTS